MIEYEKLAKKIHTILRKEKLSVGESLGVLEAIKFNIILSNTEQVKANETSNTNKP